uniref:Uncharacterized protein n=1 Tax=Emiliania huxleyi TaxID=2903 RepID=A0A7S3W450_EMIHU
MGGEVGTCPALVVSVFYECDSSNDSKTVHTSEYVYTYSFRHLTAYLLGLARPDARDSSEGYEVGDPVESRWKSYSGGWHPGVISEVHRPKRRRGGAAGGRAAGPRYTVKYTADGTSETDVPPGRLRHAVCLSSIMPAAVIEYMRRNPRSVVLTNHATAADLESVLPVVGMLALAADDLVPDAAGERPHAAGCTYEILGTLEFEFEKGCPSRPVSFKQYQRGAPLASLLPERIDTPNGVKKLIDLMPAPIVPSPASSDRSRAPTLPPLPLASGPVLQGEQLSLEVCDHLVRCVYYERDGVLSIAYGVSASPEGTISARRILTAGELPAVVTDPDSLAMLKKPAAERPYLHKNGEVVISDIPVTIEPSQVRAVGVCTAPALVFNIALARGEESVASFTLALLDGTLVATRQPTQQEARAAEVNFLLPPLQRESLRQKVQLSVMESMLKYLNSAKPIAPMRLLLENWSVQNAMVLPFWSDSFLRSGKGVSDADRVIYRYFFRSLEDFARIFGFSALQLPPTSKEQHRFAEISIYPLGDSELAELRASDEFGAKARRGPPFNSAHWVEFEPARETLTLCVGAAIFSGSVPVGGASVPPPPSFDALAGELKYVLSLGWVPVSTHAPGLTQLREHASAMPGSRF